MLLKQSHRPQAPEKDVTTITKAIQELKQNDQKLVDVRKWTEEDIRGAAKRAWK